jgi:tetratricopeptide (TPR) repeat protein
VAEAKGDREGAVALLREARAIFDRWAPRSLPGVPALLALGISLLQTGQSAAAVTELEEAAKLEPRMRQAHYQLGRAYQQLGRSQESEAAFARARELLEQEHRADRARRDLDTEPPE